MPPTPKKKTLDGCAYQSFELTLQELLPLMLLTRYFLSQPA